MKLFKSIIPLLLFITLTIPLAVKLSNSDAGVEEEFFNKSALIGKPLPKFSLPSIYSGYLGLNYNDFKEKYSLINVFASWCSACIIEHPLLLEIKKSGILPIYGISWKDQPKNTQNWLRKHGNPYTKIGSDLNGEVIISLGVSGAPESFVINKEGNIVFHYLGPLTKQVLNQEILPLLQ